MHGRRSDYARATAIIINDFCEGLHLLPVAERDKTYRELLNNLELLPEHRQKQALE